MEKVSKESVNYRPATGDRRCGNCVMFHSGTCDLVKGEINPKDVCDRWEAKVDKDITLLPVALKAMRAHYFEILDELDRLRYANVSPQRRKQLEADAWTIRKDAYPLLVKLYDEGWLAAEEAASGFSWSVNQLENESLRSWLLPKSEETPVVSTQHHPLGHEGLWHTPSKKVPERQQLPAYFQNTARALMRDHGMEESQAIATAINAVKAWARGEAFGGKVKVTEEVRQAAQRALDEWEHLKATHH